MHSQFIVYLTVRVNFLSDLFLAFICQMELKQDADGFAEFPPDCDHIQVAIIGVLRVPLGVDHGYARVHASKVEVAVIKILDHLGCRAALLVSVFPVSGMLVAILVALRHYPEFFRRLTVASCIVVILELMRVAILLEELDSGGPSAVLHLVDEHVT